jgi:N-acetylmuramoyl-L-alanine amidase
MINAMRIHRRLILRRLAGGGTILCTFLGDMGKSQAQTTPTGSAASRPLPLVILDPGHGGRDPGTTGVTGTLEKDVTLASGLALKTALEARGCYRVELTRTEDQFISREDRVDMTRNLGAHLFISLHADRLSNASVRGASVYTLARRASDAETEALANRENGLLPGEDSHAGTVAPEVSEILASLALRETRLASARIARQLVRDMERDLPVLPSPERHANFTVLHAAGIPSVLIEMGFLSNPADEAALKDPAHRQVVAGSVARAVDAWFASARASGPA